MDLRTEIVPMQWYRQRVNCEQHERVLLSQQQSTQALFELQRCRLERQALEQCKPRELAVREAARDKLIEVCALFSRAPVPSARGSTLSTVATSVSGTLHRMLNGRSYHRGFRGYSLPSVLGLNCMHTQT